MNIRTRAENCPRHRPSLSARAALLGAALTVVVVPLGVASRAAAAATDPTPGPQGSSTEGRCTQYEAALAANAPPGGWDVEMMSKFMWRESKCTPTVRSRTSDTGLLQINDVNHAHLRKVLGEWVGRWSLTDPAQNIRSAAVLCDYWQDRGESCYYPWKIPSRPSAPSPAAATTTTATTTTTTTTTTTATVATAEVKGTGATSSIAGRCTQYEADLATNAPPGGWNVEKMSGYMSAASKCNPAKRWSTATGLLRISDVNLRHLTTVLGESVTAANLTDPVRNIRAAAALCSVWLKAGKSCYAPWGG